MLAITIIIAHDSIHHHHISPGSIEIVNHHGHSQKDDHHDDSDHFPPHQHILADADFFPVRNVFMGGKVLRQIQNESFELIDPFPVKNYSLHFTGFIPVFKEFPVSSIITQSPNLTRGSPSLS